MTDRWQYMPSSQRGAGPNAPTTLYHQYRIDRASVVGAFQRQWKLRKEEIEDKIQGVTSWPNQAMQQTS